MSRDRKPQNQPKWTPGAALVVLLFTLMLPAAAPAASPLVEGYGGDQGVIGESQTGQPTASATVEQGSGPSKADSSGGPGGPAASGSVGAGSLPFTGQQLGLMAAAALGLIALGAGARIVAGRRERS